MSDLRELYQEVILDHNRQPRNFHAMPDATRQAEGFNPLCGDKVTVFLKIEEGKVADVSFQGSGCAISTASASLMTDSIKGKTLDEVEALFRTVHTMLTGGEAEAAGGEAAGVDLGKLAVFEGVREFPMRVKCATLSWHTLHAALEGTGEPVSTE
jgi:nitrogen fixation NifU-like protein